jgi:hypothetical protein
MKEADKLIPTVKIQLGDGKEVDIRCNYGLMLRFQKATGKDPFDLDAMKKMSLEDQCIFIACGVYPTEDPKDKVVEIAENMSFANFEDIWAIIGAFYKTSEAVQKKIKEEENAKKPEAEAVSAESQPN